MQPTNEKHTNFVQLSPEDCTYLLELITEMDSDTAYTERQRSYTVPKLQTIASNPRSKKLAYQDVDYLLELLEDDDLEESQQQRFMTQEKLLAIRALQDSQFARTRDIEQQRKLRRARRQPSKALSEHFERTTANVSV